MGGRGCRCGGLLNLSSCALRSVSMVGHCGPVVPAVAIPLTGLFADNLLKMSANFDLVAARSADASCVTGTLSTFSTQLTVSFGLYAVSILSISFMNS